MSLAAAVNVAEQVRAGAPYGDAPMRKALVVLVDALLHADMELDERKALMVDALDLGDQGVMGQPWDWDSVAAYARKRVGTTRLALATVKRRTGHLADALALPADTAWPFMVRRVRAYRENVTTGGPPPAIDTDWANPDLAPPASATDETMPSLRDRMRCGGCGHMWNRHHEWNRADPTGAGCHVRVETNHVDGVATALERCGCTERRPG